MIYELKDSQIHLQEKTSVEIDLFLKNKFSEINAVFLTVDQMVKVAKQKQDELFNFDFADLPLDKFLFLENKFQAMFEQEIKKQSYYRQQAIE